MNSRFRAAALATFVALAPLTDALADAPTKKAFAVKKADLSAGAKAAKENKDVAPTGVMADPTVKQVSGGVTDTGKNIAGTATDTALNNAAAPAGPFGGVAVQGTKSLATRGWKALTGDDSVGVAVVINNAVNEALKSGQPVLAFYGTAAQAESVEKAITAIPGATPTLLLVDASTAVDGKPNKDFQKGVDAIVEKGGKGSPLVQVFVPGTPNNAPIVFNAFEANEAALKPLLVVVETPAAAPAPATAPAEAPATDAPAATPPAAAVPANTNAPAASLTEVTNNAAAKAPSAPTGLRAVGTRAGTASQGGVPVPAPVGP